MGLLGFGGKETAGGAGEARLQALEAQASEKVLHLEALRRQVRERDEDRRLLLEAATALKPGMGAKALGGVLLDLCLQPLEIFTFYIALADYRTDRISFPFYYEGGKPRNLVPEALSTFNGLTTKAMADRKTRYYASLDDQTQVGVVFTEAERITGLIPQTWYGVPLGLGPGWEDRPFGLLSFQSFEKDAFSESRRALMDALAGLLALALKADRDRPVMPPR